LNKLTNFNNINAPIGIFDSGVGGLSVWQEVVRQLPYQSTIYVADSGHCPYGPRSVDELRQLSARIVQFLYQQQCQVVVVACNTASAAALYWLRTQFDLPIVGIEPAIKPAAQATKTGHIGILATEGTLQGDLFRQTWQSYAPHHNLHLRVGTGLAEQIETGQINSPHTETLLESHITALMAYPIDQLVLGCTHYPLLNGLFNKLVPQSIQLIDPAPAVVRQIKRVLLQPQPRHDGPITHRFYTTGTVAPLKQLLSMITLTQQVNLQIFRFPENE